MDNQKRFTPAENTEYLIKTVNDALANLAHLEREILSRCERILCDVAEDNTNFKQTFAESFEQLRHEVRENRDFRELENKLNEITVSVIGLKQAAENYKTLADAVNSRIDANNRTLAEGVTDYQRKMTTELNTFQQTVNQKLDLHRESMENVIGAYMETLALVHNENAPLPDVIIAKLTVDKYNIITVNYSVESLIEAINAGKVVYYHHPTWGILYVSNLNNGVIEAFRLANPKYPDEPIFILYHGEFSGQPYKARLEEC